MMFCSLIRCLRAIHCISEYDLTLADLSLHLSHMSYVDLYMDVFIDCTKWSG